MIEPCSCGYYQPIITPFSSKRNRRFKAYFVRCIRCHNAEWKTQVAKKYGLKICKTIRGAIRAWNRAQRKEGK